MEHSLTFVDIIALIALAWAMICGWRRGLISQVVSLVGFILSIWLASRYGSQAGAFFHLSPTWQNPGGFLIVVVLALIGSSLIGWLINKLFVAAGLGCLDALLGMGLAVLKWALLIGALFTAFSALNKRVHLVEEETLRKSLSFDAYCLFAETLMPRLKEMVSEVPWSEITPEIPQSDDGE